MAETQDQTRESSNTTSNILLGVLAVVLLAGGIAALLWMSRGSGQVVRIEDPTPRPLVASPVAARPIPPGPAAGGARPTISGGLASRRPGPTVHPEPNGQFHLGDIRYCVAHYDGSWQAMDQIYNFRPAPGYPRRSDGTWQTQGTWQVFNGVFDYQQTIKRIDKETFAYEASVKSAQGIATNALSLGVRLPTTWYGDKQIVLDGRPLRLPADRAGQLFSGPVQRLEIATPDGRTIIDGPAILSIQDNRQYGEDFYYIRVGFNPEAGLITQSSLKLTFRHLSDRPAAPTSQPTTAPVPAPRQ